jgi:hypothetical protein
MVSLLSCSVLMFDEYLILYHYDFACRQIANNHSFLTGSQMRLTPALVSERTVNLRVLLYRHTTSNRQIV